jgi:hypothetical protein
VGAATITVMPAERLKKRHHTAPRVYLRGFADKNELLVVRRRAGDEFVQHIDNVTVRNGFYNARTSTGVLHDDVENWFMRNIETPVGPTMTRLRAHVVGGPISGSDARLMSRFVAAQLYRTATARSYLEQIDEVLGPFLGADMTGQLFGVQVSQLSPAAQVRLMRVTRDILREHRDPEEMNRGHLRTMLRETDKMMTRLESWHWELAIAKHSRLVTGDAPAVATQPQSGVFSGILPKGSPVYLPLSPTTLLVGTEMTPPRQVQLTTRLAREVNQRVADEAADGLVKGTSQPWPNGFRLLPEPPKLPALTLERRSDGGPGTFPATYPEVGDPGIRALLEKLAARDVVL